MAEPNLLTSVLENPEAMQRLSALAGAFSGGTAPQTPETAPPLVPSDPSAELMGKAMPILSSIAESGKHAADPDRLQLLRACKPFLPVSAAAQIDKAARLLSLSQMMKTAAAQLLTPQNRSTED